MPFTPRYQFPYPGLGDSPHGPNQVQALAEAVEAQLIRIDADVSKLKSGAPYLHVYQTATQTLQHQTPTPIGMNAEFVDTINGHDTVTNNSRYTPNVAGKYRCLGQVAYFPNATGLRTCLFRKNGLIVDGQGPYGMAYGSSDGNNAHIPQAFATIHCNGTTDYIELWGQHNAGGPLSTYYQTNSTSCMMIIEWVSP